MIIKRNSLDSVILKEFWFVIWIILWISSFQMEFLRWYKIKSFQLNRWNQKPNIAFSYNSIFKLLRMFKSSVHLDFRLFASISFLSSQQSALDVLSKLFNCTIIWKYRRQWKNLKIYSFLDSLHTWNDLRIEIFRGRFKKWN